MPQAGTMSVATDDIAKVLAAAFGLPHDDDALSAFQRQVTTANISAGATLFATGDICEKFVFVAHSRARVQLSTNSGREMILFRLQPGQSCALTTSCLLTESPYYAQGIAETDMTLITAPASAFRQMIDSNPQLAKAMLDNFAYRISELTGVIDHLISRDLTAQLKQFLRNNAGDDAIIARSHQQIAEELGSSREVITRKLKILQDDGLVGLMRGRIQLTGL